MNYTEHKITLDVHKPASQATISVKKGDTAQRLLVNLSESGRPYYISEECYAVIAATKPDGYVIFNSCTIQDSVIGYDFTAQTVAAVGLMNCEIILYGKRGLQLTSASFDIIIEDSNFSAVESSSEATAFATLIMEIKALNALGVRAPAIVCEAEGENISISGTSNDALQGLRIFGKSTQEGEPTMDSPVEIVSLAAPVVTITDGTNVQAMAIADILPGIPVDSGGNYTDSDGQQWICDEVDLGRGVYVRRIYTEVVTAEKIIRVDNEYTTAGGAVAYFTLANKHFSNGNIRLVMCDKTIGIAYNNRGNPSDIYRCYAPDGDINVVAFRYPISEGEKTIEEARSDFAGATVSYVLATPIETALTEEETAAFAQLHTYKPNTTIYNDVGAHMAVEYVADTKTYVDRKGGSGSSGGSAGSAVTLGIVTLAAARWEGEADPYYQVVNIAGVTENSQVDLKPSVEQLAIFHDKDLAFVTENDGGVVTAYAIGEKPTNDYTMQVTITEVNV